MAIFMFLKRPCQIATSTSGFDSKLSLNPGVTLQSWLLCFACGAIASVSLDVRVWAQGGGNANSVGLSLEASLKSSASAANGQSATPPGPPAGTPSGLPTGPGGPMDSSRAGSSMPSGPPAGDMSGSMGNYNMSMGSSSSGQTGYGADAQSTANGAQRFQTVMSTAYQQVSTGLASLFSTSAQDVEAKANNVTLWEEAALAFHQGDQKKSLALFHAHIIADGDDAINSRTAVDYSRLLKRPVWAVRFGVSVHPRIPDSLLSDPEPIREGMAVAGPRARGRGMAGGASEGGLDSSSVRPPRGLVSRQDVSRQDVSRQDDAMSMAMNSRMTDEFGGGSGMPVAKKIVTTLGGAATEEVKKTLDRVLGLVAEVTSTMFASRFDSGKFGRAFDGMMPAGAELASLRTDAGDTTPSDLPMWIPGVDFVGEGPVTDMTVAAKRSEIDFLLHFDVIVKENRLGTPSYAARCKLVHVESGEVLGISKAIDKAEIAAGTSAVLEAVTAQMTNLFEILDKKVSVEPMPALQSTHAVSRIDSLLGSNKARSMRSLAEIMMFCSRDLITPEQLDQVFLFAGGEDVLRLLHDDVVSRYETVKSLIDQELNKAEPE